MRPYRKGTKEQDIKAPDGYLLGGIRRVRQDGTILFQRTYWKAPAEWIGKDVWVHEVPISYHDNAGARLDVAPPGLHIYEAQCCNKHVVCEPAEKPSAKPGYRIQAHKDWAGMREGNK